LLSLQVKNSIHINLSNFDFDNFTVNYMSLTSLSE